MELGLHVAKFTWDGGVTEIAPTLAKVATTAEDAGFTRITVMDHLWQIGMVGAPEMEMLEAYTTLGYLAAVTKKVRLHTLVTGVIYREPGLLAKLVTTLDVLSGGRAGLGIGAAWFEEEARGLGLPFPPTAERFERLEETLQICLQMWSGNDAPYEGTHYQLGRTLNSPAAISTPHPYLMVGGAGERKTLRLVAKYADACNIFLGEETPRKLEALREHCEREGRNYDDIEKTTLVNGTLEGGAEPILAQLRHAHELGFTVAEIVIREDSPLPTLEMLGNDVIPEISRW